MLQGNNIVSWSSVVTYCYPSARRLVTSLVTAQRLLVDMEVAITVETQDMAVAVLVASVAVQEVQLAIPAVATDTCLVSISLPILLQSNK